MVRISRTFLKVAMCLFVAGAAAAEDLSPVQGSETEEFKAALSSWLEGNDLESLHAFSELARSGNTAAQILLGRISEHGAFYEHLTTIMPRDERIALLKQPGGLSGRSWLLAAEESEPLATAFLQATRLGEKPGAVQALLELGESVAAMKAGMDLLYSGEAQELLDALASADDVPLEAIFLILQATKLADATAYTGSGRIPGMGLVADKILSPDVTLTWLTPPPRDLIDSLDLLRAVANETMNVKAWTPLAGFCTAHCSDSRGTCIALGASLAPGSPFPFSSPTERLVPNEVYWASTRMEGDLVRKYQDLSSNGWQDALAGIDACFMPKIAELQAAMKP